jgi:hypothetical protein
MQVLEGSQLSQKRERNEPGARRSPAGRTWVLDTETKGTGAEMVPLEKVQRRSRAREERVSATNRGRRQPARPSPKPEPPQEPKPRRFKVVDVLSREVIAEDASAHTVVDLLEGTRSVVDLRVYVHEDANDWRPLTLAEQRAMRGIRRT